ncbi:HlyD family efflux transporter periplasmic adaptor subunit [Flammeovirgaceae bacterium SG7u.111]|nr:HlyD family efflux transporter periplasmic adaptor subunit [Flammeovirgaceae bacterium SG7u.132]WPO36305.1 HlyD family efflux transporter periplasmic adaptor subunit [Flammeovirgaceae bacterium SG7u.111]
MKTALSVFTLLSFLLLSCTEEEKLTDATGVFEATEIIVSSEANGKLLSLQVDEGEELKKGKLVGQIDTTQLYLQKLQLKAQQATVQASRPDISAQIAATEREITKQEYEEKRIEKLLAGDVATQKQLDDIKAQIQILKARLVSQKSSLYKSSSSIDAQVNTIDVQIAQVEDQLGKCKVKSPIDGTVLVKYAEEGEMTATGKALFKIADMDNMILKAYVTSDQLTNLKIGQEIKVLAEFGKEENKEYQGKVTWISSKSEFTPKTIQTQDERANLVYAVKVAVPNDGYLKIGMYGGVKF